MQATQEFLPSSSGMEGGGDGSAGERSISPPALVATVVAHQSGTAEEAARARKDLESAGKMVQERWGECHGQGNQQDEGVN